MGDVRHNIGELAGGIKEFSKAGVDVSTSLRDIGEMSRFASIAEMELVDATKLVIGQANAFGETYADAANMIAAAALSSATDIGEMATAMSYTTELGSVAKVEFSEVAAAMGVLANSGIRGSKAGTALRTSILRMQNPTEKLKGMLQEMNIQWSAFTSEGKVKSIQAMFSELSRAMDSAQLTDQQVSAFQKELFGLKSLKGGANILREATDGFVSMNEAVERSTQGVTFLQQATEDLENTTVVMWDKVKKAFSDSITSAFENDESLKAMLVTLREIGESEAFLEFLRTSTSLVQTLGTAAEAILSPLGAIISLIEEAGRIAGYIPGVSELGDAAAKMGQDFWKNLDVMEKYREAVRSVDVVLQDLSVTNRQMTSPDMSGFSPTHPLSPGFVEGNPILQQAREMEEAAKRIDLALDSAFASIDVFSGSDAVSTAAKQYADNFNSIEKAIASLDDKIFAAGKGSSALAEYEFALANITRTSEQAKKALSEQAGMDSYTGENLSVLTSKTAEYEAVMRSAAEAKFKLAEQQSIATLEKDIAKFLGSSSQELSEFDRISQGVNASLAELEARVKSEALKLYGDDDEATLARINELLEGRLDLLSQAADDQVNERQTALVRELETGLSDLASKHIVLSRAQQVAAGVNKDFDDAIAGVNKRLGEANPEAVRLAGAYEQLRAAALATNIELLKMEGGFKGGIAAALIEAQRATQTLGELSHGLTQDFLGGIKGTLSAAFRFEFDEIGGLWESTLDTMKKRAADWAADWVIDKGISMFGDLFGVDVSGFGKGPNGSSGSPFHVVVQNWEGAAGAGGFGGSLFSEDGKVASWVAETFGEQAAQYFGYIGGAIGVGAGAYGMYSGAKDISKGNYGSGVVKVGLGATSAYQGAVTLGLIEKGAFTGAMKGIGSSLGIGGGSTATAGAAASGYVGGSGGAVSGAYGTSTGYIAATEGMGMASVASSGSSGATSAAGASGGGGMSAAGIGTTGFFAAAAIVAAKIVYGMVTDPSLDTVMRDKMNRSGAGEEQVVGAGIGNSLTSVNESMRSLVPALESVSYASYDAQDGMLTLGHVSRDFVQTGVEGQGYLRDSIEYTSLALDRATGQWVTTRVSINDYVDQMTRQMAILELTGQATDEATQALARQMAMQSGFPSIADEIYQAYMDQKSAGTQLTGVLGMLSGNLGRTEYAATSMASAAGASAEMLRTSASDMRGSIYGVGNTMSGVTSQLNSGQGALAGLGNAAADAAGRISGAAGQISSAASAINSITLKMATWSPPPAKGNAMGAIYDYHARGAVMTQPTVFHVGGEAGAEAIMPLHKGPQTLQFMDAKLDAVLRSAVSSEEMRAILVAVATYTKKAADILTRFEYIGIPTSKREAVA